MSGLLWAAILFGLAGFCLELASDEDWDWDRDEIGAAVCTALATICLVLHLAFA